MRCLIVYDISSNRLRAKVANMCLDYGLSRIQLSAFLGTLSRNHQDELLMKVRRWLGKEPGRVALFPLCDTDFRCRIEVGEE
jgi:CRISPR-associated protein Cas2